jgi:hypothetical protein
MSVVACIVCLSKEMENKMSSESKKYTLVEYNFGGKRVVSAIHYRDLWKFLAENKDSVILKR